MNRFLSILLVPYTLWIVFGYDFHFLDWLNLAFHEAGHLVFTPLGQTMHFLGGTFGQLVFPIVIGVHFHRERKRFEVGVAALWLCESLMNVAWYMADAQAMVHPLVGGGVHDWNWLLGRWGLIGSCTTLAGGLHAAASLGAFAAVGYAIRTAFSDAANEPALPSFAEATSGLGGDGMPIGRNAHSHGGDTYGAPPPKAPPRP